VVAKQHTKGKTRDCATFIFMLQNNLNNVID